MSVRRRKVFYLPGFDPVPPRRYREIYRREGAAQAEISGYRLIFGPRRDRTGFGWGVTGEFGDHSIETEIEVLGWTDVVTASMGQSIPATYGQLIRTAWTYISTGAFGRMIGLRRGPVLAALYPIVMLIGQALIALLAAGLILRFALAALPLLAAIPIGIVAGLAAFWAILVGFRRLDGRLFAYYLMHDFAFTARHGGAYPQILEDRLARFSARVAAVLDEGWDEVLVVGHSSGAYLAVSVMADLLRQRAATEDNKQTGTHPALALLTLGHVVPMASFLPRAERLRADLALLATSPDLAWVDVTAPGDACSFGLCDPVAVSGVAPEGAHNPLILSAAFTKTLSPEKQTALRNRWFRLHFQYLHAFDRPGDYDYFAITAGPLTLAGRYADRRPSPGRITRPVNRFTSMRAPASAAGTASRHADAAARVATSPSSRSVSSP